MLAYKNSVFLFTKNSGLLFTDYIELTFKEKGQRSTKKGLLSSKEKEIWICECGHQNDMGDYCSCGKDLYGFKEKEVNAERALSVLRRRSSLIKECLNN
jgi:hypothetical protein